MRPMWPRGRIVCQACSGFEAESSARARIVGIGGLYRSNDELWIRGLSIIIRNSRHLMPNDEPVQLAERIAAFLSGL